MTTIKLYPTEQADALLRAAYARYKADHEALGLRPMSLSTWIVSTLVGTLMREEIPA